MSPGFVFTFVAFRRCRRRCSSDSLVERKCRSSACPIAHRDTVEYSCNRLPVWLNDDEEEEKDENRFIAFYNNSIPISSRFLFRTSRFVESFRIRLEAFG